MFVSKIYKYFYRKYFMKFEVLKGTKDFLPKEQIKINEVLDIIREGFEGYGFRPLDTPLIEYFDTLAMKYDSSAEIVQEIFKVTDRGERELGLRYDLTTPLCRFIAENNKSLKKPFRRYQIGKVFRDGPIKAGRLREFIQCDGDVIGVSGIEIEAELLIMFFETYKKLGIDAIIEINNNKILRGAFLQNGFKEKDLSSLILSVDKLKKIGEKGVLDEIKEKGFEVKSAKSAIEILSSKDFSKIEKLAKDELLIQGINELNLLANLIKPYVNFRVNFSMSRGLDIYTGNIWESYDKAEKISSSIGSGGRYDKVISEYMNSTEEMPAVGVSFGLIPILECLKNENSKEGVSEILVVPLEENLVSVCFKIAQEYRKKGKKVEMFYGYKIKKAFEYAEFLGCEEVIILGKKDVENKEYTLKNIVSGKEEKVKF